MMVQNKLAQVCGDVLYCDVSDMEALCSQILDEEKQRQKRQTNRRQILVNFKMIGQGNQTMNWLSRKLTESKFGQGYQAITEGKQLQVSLDIEKFIDTLIFKLRNQMNIL